MSREGEEDDGGEGRGREHTGQHWPLAGGEAPRPPEARGESRGSGRDRQLEWCQHGSRPPGEPRDDLGTWRGCGGTGRAGWGLSGRAEQAGSLEESRNPGIGECLRSVGGGGRGEESPVIASPGESKPLQVVLGPELPQCR